MLTPETARVLLSVYAPALSVDLSDAQLNVLLSVSSLRRPACLSDARADEAQMYFLLYLLLLGKATDPNAAGSLQRVVSQKLGEEQVTFATTDASSDVLSPDYWLRRWQALDAICTSLGSITSGGVTGGCCGDYGGDI